MPPVSPTWNVLYEVCAIFNCLTGTHASLLLASASIHLHLPKLMVLAALQFSVQSIFSLHFISMCGMVFPLSWGFDVGLVLASFAIVIVFGTSAITLILFHRHRLQPHIERESALQMGLSRESHVRLLYFILSHIPFTRLLLAVTLLGVGVAGCHHVGMWSIHGLAEGAHLACVVNLWSLLTTGVVGGAVCLASTLAFLFVPEGPAAVVAAAVLTGGIAAFHFSSATWGMQYAEGTEGVTTGIILGNEVDVLFLVAQGVIGQVVTAIFSQMAVGQHAAATRQLELAQTLGQHIARMDLEPAKAMQLAAANPSELEKVLFRIVGNLLAYRPYLPDTLFAVDPPEEGASPGRPRPVGKLSLQALLAKTGSTVRSPSSSVFGDSAEKSLPYPAIPQSASLGSLASRCRAARKGDTQRRSLALGLLPSHLTVLRTRLQGLWFGEGPALNCLLVEQRLADFMAVATAQVKARGGTIVTCSSGLMVAFWSSLSPDTALETAMAIQQQCNQDLIQLVQAAPFLAGNLATEHLRSFNVVGPLDWPGQLLLRLGGGGRHVFVTSHEWHSVHLRYPCLPYEEVLLGDRPATVYTVLPPPRTAGDTPDKEWMYEVEGNLRSPMAAEVTRCWQAYVQGSYAEVKHLAPAIPDAPLWYSQHLVALADAALAAQARQPTKSLEALGWPTAADFVSQDGVQVIDL